MSSRSAPPLRHGENEFDTPGLLNPPKGVLTDGLHGCGTSVFNCEPQSPWLWLHCCTHLAWFRCLALPIGEVGSLDLASDCAAGCVILE